MENKEAFDDDGAAAADGAYDVRSGYIPYDKKGKPQKEKTYKFKESLPVKFMQGDEELYGQLDEL